MLQQELAREMKPLDIVLCHQGILKVFLKTKLKDLPEQQKKTKTNVRREGGAQKEKVAPET